LSVFFYCAGHLRDLHSFPTRRSSDLNTMHEVWDHPQLKARERWREVGSSVGPLPAMLPPGTWNDAPRMDPVPAPGEHTDATLAELGFGADAIRTLREPGATGWRTALTPPARPPRRGDLMDARTYLFVPGNRPERFVKALASGADAVVLDLEDAVAPPAKGEARDAVAQWCDEITAHDRARLVVRINDAHSSAFADDLRLLRHAGVAGVMLPKAESAAHVQAVRAAVPDARVLALVESARGAAAAHEV